MANNSELIQSSIVRASADFKSRSTPASGLEATVDVYMNGMIILKSRVGEIILKLMNADHIQAGSKLLLFHEKNSDLVNISVSRKPVVKANPAPKFDDEVRIRPAAPSAYRPRTALIDEIKGHHTAAEATLESAISEASKTNAYDIARSICLMPDMDRDRGMISIMTFLLVSLTRGNVQAWSGGYSNTQETSWDHVMKERLFDGPDTKPWKSRQFPINLTNDTLWAIFATPADNTGPVSRFIVEIPTKSYGLVQVKAFGQGDNAEIVITSQVGFNDDLKVKCHSAVTTIASEIDAEIAINFVNDPTMLANLSQARRTSFEA